MFWNRKIKCPITPADKSWIEDRLDWIDRKLLSLSEQKTILPTPDFFGEKYDASMTAARLIFHKIGDCMGIDTYKIKLDFYQEGAGKSDRFINSSGKGTLGLYSGNPFQQDIQIEIQSLKQAERLVAVMAHELSHHFLISQRNIRIEGIEEEYITDLLTIVFGFGIFMGNSKFIFQQWQDADGWQGWSTSSSGYLPQPVIAYALAELEVRKGALELPDWTKYLKRDFKGDFKRSMKYILQEMSS
ncbi:MAG: hypothetical protein AAF696_28515 [Bacteroidota bacterium]